VGAAVPKRIRAVPLPFPPLLVISDRSQARRPIGEVAEAAFRAGCRWFGLREKDLPADERRELLRALISLGQRYDAIVMVHEDIEAVVAEGAGGVHLPGGGDVR
jgi:thiamine-phosphate pyrophosphorylase